MEFLYRACRLPGYPLVGTSENHSSSLSKAFERVWRKDLLAKRPAYSFISSLCKFISSFYPVTLYLLLMVQPLHPSQSPMVFLRVQSFHLRIFFSS